MKILAKQNRELIMINAQNTRNENRAETITLVVPEEYEDYNKKIVFITPDGNVWDIITNNEYKITNAITKYKDVEFYIWLTKEVDGHTIDFRTKTKPLIFFNNIDASDEITEEEIGGVTTVINLLEEEIDKVENLNLEAEKIETVTTITITKKDGTTKEVSINDGEKGDKGDTPIRGVDYWTEEDKQEIIDESTVLINGKIEEYNDNAALKTNTFNQNATEKTNNYNTNAEQKMSAYNTNATEKLNNYNTNATQKTTDYNTNASEKLSSYNQNATQKINAYDTNASDKLSAYNTNASEKLSSYNQNATQKINDFDSHTEEIQDKYNRLKATLPTTGEVTGQDITLDKTAEMEFKKPPLPMGNSEQNGTPSTNNEVPITNVTGDVEVVVQNKNFFNGNSSNFDASWDGGNSNKLTLLSNGNIQTTADYSFWRAKAIDIKSLKPNTQYTLSIELISATSTQTNKAVIRIPYNNGTSGGYVNFNGNESLYQFNSLGKQTFTFTTPNDMVHIGLSLNSDGSDTTAVFGNIMIEKGSTATSYMQHQEQTFIFPLGNEKLMLGDYLADDGIHHVRAQATESGTAITLNDAKNNGAYLCNKKTSGNLAGKTLTFDEAITDALIEYELEEEVIVPYTSAQQTAYNQIKQALSYEEQTNISSNQNAIFNVEAYLDTKVILSEKVDKIAGKGLSTNDFTNTYKNSVDSNTSARHTHANKTVLDGIASSDITNWNGKQNETDNSLNTTNKAITGAINEVYSIARGANQAVSYSNYQAMITVFNSLTNDIYNVGQNVMIVTLQVPDLWISGIESTSVPYTYTTDEAVTTALSTNGYIQVGYYKLSALETQKVDLTDYEQNTNKTTTISSSSTNAQYPSAKAVYDYIQSLDGDEVSY